MSRGDVLRVLHLFSNCKWTGPAEPALNLCLALRARGVQAQFACAPDSGRSINKIVETARDRGLEPVLDFHLSKHRRWWQDTQDRRRLYWFLQENPVDIIHCHLDNDHALAAAVAPSFHIPIVRSSYTGTGFAPTRRSRKLLAHTDWLLQPSEVAAQKDAQTFGYSQAHMTVTPGAVDTQRFDSTRETPDGRRWLNVPSDAFVVGIVARMQTHRHYEELFQAFCKLVDAVPKAHLIVVGRGTKQEQVGMKPVRELGLDEHVHFSGYVDGENYVGMLRAFDVGVFLTPGSDGTCRAAREILAMAKPMVVADRGMLREIVPDQQCGYVVDTGGEPLFEALLRLAQDRQLRFQLGQQARQRAEEIYSLQHQSKLVHDVYMALLRRV